MLLDLEKPSGTAAVRPLVAAAADENGASIAPNGTEILFEKFPEGGQKTRAASGDGAPLWSPDGRDLYFTFLARGGSELEVMAARVELAPTLRISKPRRLFSGPFMRSSDMGALSPSAGTAAAS